VHCAWYQNDTNNVDFTLPRLGLELSASALVKDIAALPRLRLDKTAWAHPCFKGDSVIDIGTATDQNCPETCPNRHLTTSGVAKGDIGACPPVAVKRPLRIQYMFPASVPQTPVLFPLTNFWLRPCSQLS